MLYYNLMKISIVTASYNYQDYIKETIQSVLDQTYKDWEFIIVDDCSTDNSVEVIKSYKDDRIKLFVNEKNLGLKETLKFGIKQASGDWVAILESDDILKQDYLEKKYEVIKRNPNVAVIFNDVELFGDENRVKNTTPTIIETSNLLQNKIYPCNIFDDLVDFNRVLTFSAVMLNRQKFLECNLNTPMDKLFDWWLFLHLARKYDFYYIPEKLTKWRLHSGSYISYKEKLFDYPVNVAALIDLIKKEKDIRLFPPLFKASFSTAKRFKSKLFRAIKKTLGIPLREEMQKH